MSPSRDPAQSRILIIDDEPGMTQLLGRILRGRHEVVLENDPRSAVARFTAGERFDVVLCDVMMAPFGGLDVYEQTVKVAPHMAARFMLMTGGTTNYELERRLAGWRHGLLFKPFNVADVIALIAGKLERLRGTPMQHDITIP